MPPPLALTLTLLLIGYLLRRDCREEPRVSTAVWIPIVWLMINGSRQASQWFGSGPLLSAEALSEGSPIDQIVYGVLIIAGVSVLVRRDVRMDEVVKNNIPIVLFLLYEGLSVIWSDFPFTSFKRWGKALGDPIMVLVLWSDPYPVRAITATIKRCAYVLIPLSILFCKYYENLGRVFDPWGKSHYTGVTLDKNMFGYLLFAFGLFFVASFVDKRHPYVDDRNRWRIDQMINILLLAMISWLIPIANSKTATVAMLIGIIVIVASQFASIRRHFWIYTLGVILLLAIFNELFSIRSFVAEASGRDTTFTGRTGIWERLLQEPINPLLGVGYNTFWFGERLKRWWEMEPNTLPIQAHNGYIEVYLNLGLIGLCLIATVLWKGVVTMQNRIAASFDTSLKDTCSNKEFATFGLAYCIAYLIYNITEATFQGLNFLFLIFMFLTFNYRHSLGPVQQVSRRLSVASRSRLKKATH